ncbi:MAG: CopG family transcriptional regulator [Oscillospiraceae bacterium]|nr:CopG family transcriptional regulator [Oscillospiraceae bacterium]
MKNTTQFARCQFYDRLYSCRNQCSIIHRFYHLVDLQSKKQEVSRKVEKRKTKTTSAVKNRYNQKVYDVISVRVPKAEAEAFREKCNAEGIPQAQVIKEAIRAFLNNAAE